MDGAETREQEVLEQLAADASSANKQHTALPEATKSLAKAANGYGQVNPPYLMDLWNERADGLLEKTVTAMRRVR